MKLFEIETWDNLPVTKEFLYKKQLSTCHQFITYVEMLARKYPIAEWFSNIEIISDGWIQQATAQRFLASWSPNDRITEQMKAQISEQEFKQFLTKFHRMIAAKREYEKAGGKVNRSKSEYV